MQVSPRALGAESYSGAWVLALSLPQLVGWGSLYYAYALLIGPMEEELALGKLELAGAFSLALLVEGLVAYPVGRFIDRGHARWVMTSGSLLAAFGLWLLAQVHSGWQLYGAWALLGCAMAMVLYTAAFAVVTHRFPQNFRRAIITLSLLGGLASTVFIPLVAWMVQHIGWRQALEAMALLQLLLSMPLHATLLRAPCAHMRQAAPRRSATERYAAELAQLLRSRSYWLVCTFVVLMTTVSAALPIHMVGMLRSFSLEESWAVLVPASMGVFQVAARLLLYVSEKRLDVQRANTLIPALIPLGLLLLLLGSVAPPAFAVGFALAFVALFGMGNGMLTIVKGSAMAEYVSPIHVASLNGALGIPLALARASAPLALAAMWSLAWGYTLGLLVLLLLSLAGVAALRLAQRTKAVLPVLLHRPH